VGLTWTASLTCECCHASLTFTDETPNWHGDDKRLAELEDAQVFVLRHPWVWVQRNMFGPLLKVETGEVVAEEIPPLVTSHWNEFPWRLADRTPPAQITKPEGDDWMMVKTRVLPVSTMFIPCPCCGNRIWHPTKKDTNGPD
jgi:hypothetical protein